MAWPTISASITRTELGSSALALSSATGYEIMPDGFSEAETVSNNVYSSSRWVDGAAVTASKLELSSVQLRVKITGTSTSDLYTRIEALKNALTQFSFTMSVTMDGATRTYACMSATSVSTDTFSPALIRGKTAFVSAVIPRQPQIA